jgi:hypothetical protein
VAFKTTDGFTASNAFSCQVNFAGWLSTGTDLYDKYADGLKFDNTSENFLALFQRLFIDLIPPDAWI